MIRYQYYRDTLKEKGLSAWLRIDARCFCELRRISFLFRPHSADGARGSDDCRRAARRRQEDVPADLACTL